MHNFVQIYIIPCCILFRMNIDQNLKKKIGIALLLHLMSLNNYLLLLKLWEGLDQRQRIKKRRWRVRPMVAVRLSEGTGHILLNKMLNDGFVFEEYLRVDRETFETILQKIEPVVERSSKFRKDVISPRIRLAVTLRYLATGIYLL